MSNSQKSSIEVIGAGCARTGTTSLKLALEILGLDPCYHMREVTRNGQGNFWVKVVNKEKYDFDEVFRIKSKVYKASCDFPSSIFWKEQLERYPDAKVLLTVRAPEKWYKSCSDTIFYVLPRGPFSNLGIRISLHLMGISNMNEKVFRDFFHNNWNKENLIKCYNDHNAKVIAECPKDKLLVYEMGQGWEPICKFLNKPIPNVPFPNVNDTKHFQRGMLVLSVVGYTLLVLLMLLPVGVAWYVAKSINC